MSTQLAHTLKLSVPTVQRSTLPLSLVRVGERVEVVDVQVQGSEKRRLHELGLLPGASVQVVKSDANVGLILAVRQDGRLAISRSIAHKILVCFSGMRE